jgi:hypothetical protein
MNKLSKNDLKARHHGLTVGDLRKFLMDHPEISDDQPVLIERVEDIYFQKHGWGVYLKEGEVYHNMLSFNENMRNEIDRRGRGEEPEYGMEDPSMYIKEPSEEDMNQYVPAWCCVKYKDDDALFIDLHY